MPQQRTHRRAAKGNIVSPLLRGRPVIRIIGGGRVQRQGALGERAVFLRNGLLQVGRENRAGRSLEGIIT